MRAVLDATSHVCQNASMSKTRLSDLNGLGPKSVQMLAAVGIYTAEQLATCGSVAAFVALKQSGQTVSLNMLWALEAALSGRDWRQVAREDRLRLLLELQEHEAAR